MLWIKDSFHTEAGEFERVANDYFPTQENKYHELENLYANAQAITLTEALWKQLQNTDSFTTYTIEAIEQAMLNNGEARDIGKVLYDYASLVVASPIVLSTTHELTLVAGNTRLMVARMLKIRPRVIMIETNW
jgi:hypothetical protein